MCVCSLQVEHEEFGKGQSEGLVKFYESCGCEVVHSPIVDFSLPSFEVEDKDIVAITSKLEEGKSCLAHCWGGSGRTGTVVIGVVNNTGVQHPIVHCRKHPGKSIYLDIPEQEGASEHLAGFD